MIKTSPKEAQAIIEACKETILISLKAFDETAAVRVLVYSNHFIDLPQDLLDHQNFTNV